MSWTVLSLICKPLWIKRTADRLKGNSKFEYCSSQLTSNGTITLNTIVVINQSINQIITNHGANFHGLYTYTAISQ